MVVAPATANILAKTACGIADDLLSTTLVADAAPVLVAPGDERGHVATIPATQRNLDTLRQRRGAISSGPASAAFWPAGTRTWAAWSEPEADRGERWTQLLAPEDATLAGRHGAGHRRADAWRRIDPVRFITNRSTGQDGLRHRRGGGGRAARKVTLASGPVSTSPRRRACAWFRSKAPQQLCDAGACTCAAGADVGDSGRRPRGLYARSVTPSTRSKRPGERHDAARSTPTTDIAARAGTARKRPGQVLVAFAAETERSDRERPAASW